MSNHISKVKSQSEKYEIHDWESILSDVRSTSQFRKAYENVIVDPTLFQANFAYLPLKGQIKNLYPYDYQDDYYKDESNRRICVKSRQIGFTTTVAFRQYHKGGYILPGHECTFIHLVEENAYKYLDIMNKLNNNLPTSHLRLNFVKNNTKGIQIDNGTIFRIKSANAAEGSRGFTTDAVLDEFALVSKSDNLMNAAGSAAVRGFSIDILSTPFGRANNFHRLIKDTSYDTTKVIGSIVEYKQIEQSGRKLLKDGYFEGRTGPECKNMMYDWVREHTKPLIERDIITFRKEYERVKRNNISDYSLHVVPWFVVCDMDWAYIMSLGLSYDGLMQEYFLAFLDSAGTMLGYQEIMNCVVPDLEMASSKHGIHYADRNIYLGVDPSSGKVNETAWMFLAEPIWNKDKVLIEPWRVLYYETTWDKRHKYVKRLAKQIKKFKPIKIFIDEPGIGIAVMEDLVGIHGIQESSIEGINAGNTIREAITYNAVSLVQSGLVMLPDDPRLIDQLFALEKVKTTTGKFKFTGKINSSDGQDDLYWAYAFGVCIGGGRTRGQYRMDGIEVGDIDMKQETDYKRVKDTRYF